MFFDCEYDKTWKENEKERKAIKKAIGFTEETSVSKLKDGEILVKSSKFFKDYQKDNVLLLFDENERLMCKFEYNSLADKKNQEQFEIIEVDDKAIFGFLTTRKDKEETIQLIVIEKTTSKILAKNPINGINPQSINLIEFYKHKFFSDKLIWFCPNSNIGYCKLVINKKDYSVTTSFITFKEDFKKFIPNINKYGFVSSTEFVQKDLFIFKDESMILLTEKVELGSDRSKWNTKDIVCFFIDKNFKITDIKTFEKHKSKNELTDYLFSQYLNNDENVVFFYKDYQKNDETKDKNWILFINTLIKGEFKQEQVVISSKKDNFLIVPYIAKDGYILLREYNDKEKYNQIRLEKLNF